MEKNYISLIFSAYFKKISSLFLVLCFLGISTNIQAQSLTIGGSSIPNSLGLEVFDDGSYKVSQVIISTSTPRTDDGTERSGSFIYNPDLSSGCSLGFQTGTNPASQVSNTLAGNEINTVANCFSGDITWTQRVIYNSGNSAEIEWEITNNSSTTSFNNLLFYHVIKTPASGILNSTSAFEQPSISKYGLVNYASSTLNTISLQAFIPPDTFDVDSTSAIIGRVPSGSSLTNTLDTNTGTPHSIALQWSKPLMFPGETWVLKAVFQSLSAPIVENIFIIPPADSAIIQGQPESIPFLVGNADTANSTTVAAINATIPSAPSDINILSISESPGFSVPVANVSGAPGLKEVSVQIDALALATLGEIEQISLNLVPTSSNIIGQTSVVVIAAPPTPTPLFTPTSLPSPTPAVAPTATPIFRSPPLPTPTATATNTPGESPISISFPFNSTGSLTPKIQGQAFPGSIVELFVDDQLMGTTQADASGNWQINISKALAIGPHFLVAGAIDPFNRKSSNPPFRLIVTGGAEGDFEGDGYTDLTSYKGLGSSIVYRVKKSSDDSSLVAYAKGQVPSAADYDGDGITDYAAIGRSGKTFSWYSRLSSNQAEDAQLFGQRGDTLITACRFNAPNRASLAAFRGSNLLYRDIFSSDVKEVEKILPADFSFIGCADTDNDGIDELIVSSNSSEKTISSIGLNKVRTQLKTVSGFSKAYVMRVPGDPSPLLLLVRTVSASRRSIEPLSLLGDQIFEKIAAPRKLIVGSALVDNEKNNLPSKGYYFQDLKSGEVSGYLLGETDGTDSFDRIARGSRVVISQYIYTTR